MGVTIHFEGKLRGGSEYEALLRTVRDFAASRRWEMEEIPEDRRSLKRVRDEKDWDYVGLTKGIVVHPHVRAEPLRFEFDENLEIQEYCKTQFAGAAAHISVLELLRILEPLFASLTVEDEGEYWDRSDASVLSHHMRSIDAQIAGLVAEKPSYRVAVRLPSGRITDLMR